MDLVKHSIAKYILELGLLDYSMVSNQPSHIMASALYLSPIMTEKELSSVWNSHLQHYSAYSTTQLMPTVKKVASMIAKAGSTKLQAVRTNY